MMVQVVDLAVELEEEEETRRRSTRVSEEGWTNNSRLRSFCNKAHSLDEESRVNSQSENNNSRLR